MATNDILPALRVEIIQAGAAEGGNMSVLIKGMEMPIGKDVLTVAITADGEVYSIGFDNTIEGGIFLSHPSTYPIQAVPVPPHERLVDADAFWVEINNICDRRDAGIISDFTCLQQILSALRHAPTIIPASEEGE